MEALRGRTRRASQCSSSSTRRPSTRTTTRVVAKGVPVEVGTSLREAAMRTCAPPATSSSRPKGQKLRPMLATIGGIGLQLHLRSMEPAPSSHQGNHGPEADDLDFGKIDSAGSKPLANDRHYTTTGKSFASNTLRDCCCHSQTNISTLEALHQLKDVLITREINYEIDQHYMIRHPELEARMRRILLDWMMEVCESMVLRRETFHLAVNLLDRYMSLKSNIGMEHVQLIGVACLFITAKLEEIDPLRASTCAYITDCYTEEDIRAMELDILSMVKFRLNTVTANTWVAVWMLYMHTEGTESTSEYDAKLFVRVMELVDLALCDMGCLQHSNRTLALAAFYVVTKNWSLPASLGFRYCDVQTCAEWLTSYYAIMNICGASTSVKSFDGVPANEALNIQHRRYSMEDFVTGRDGPKEKLAPPAQFFTAPLAPKSLGFHQCGLPGALTPLDRMLHDRCM